MDKIGIIGGAGFIGSHVTKTFLEEGYTVKTSVLDINNLSDYNHLKELKNAENLEIFPLNAEDKEQLKAFIADCNTIVHAGTPFKLDFYDPHTELLNPTIKGTENVLDILNAATHLKNVVFVSSVTALNTNFPMPAGDKMPNESFDEGDVFISEESHPYAQAKSIANQTVNKYIQDHPALNFEIVSVAPVMVMGKSLNKNAASTSVALQHAFKNEIPADSFIQMMFDNDLELAIIDVKDVAKAIYNAATKKGLHGKNYLLSSESWKVSDITAMLNNRKPLGTPQVIYQNNRAKEDLNINFNPAAIPLREFSEA